MFREVRQRGFLSVFQSFGSSPLEIWDMKVRNGSVRRVMDEQVRALALEIAGTNISTCYVYCPKDSRTSLGIHMPFLVMIIKSLKKYFSFEVTIIDDRHVKRRFRFSNFQKMNRIHHFCATMPLCLDSGWNEICFDLANLTNRAYKTNYIETCRIQINANCRIRVIYFCDRIYDDKDTPQKYQIFLPKDHVCQAKKEEESLKKVESEYMSEYEGESGTFEEEEEIDEESQRSAAFAEEKCRSTSAGSFEDEDRYGTFDDDLHDDLKEAPGAE